MWRGWRSRHLWKSVEVGKVGDKCLVQMDGWWFKLVGTIEAINEKTNGKGCEEQKDGDSDEGGEVTFKMHFIDDDSIEEIVPKHSILRWFRTQDKAKMFLVLNIRSWRDTRLYGW